MHSVGKILAAAIVALLAATVTPDRASAGAQEYRFEAVRTLLAVASCTGRPAKLWRRQTPSKAACVCRCRTRRSEEDTSDIHSLMRHSYADFCSTQHNNT